MPLVLAFILTLVSFVHALVIIGDSTSPPAAHSSSTMHILIPSATSFTPGSYVASTVAVSPTTTTTDVASTIRSSYSASFTPSPAPSLIPLASPFPTSYATSQDTSTSSAASSEHNRVIVISLFITSIVVALLIWFSDRIVKPIRRCMSQRTIHEEVEPTDVDSDIGHPHEKKRAQGGIDGGVGWGSRSSTVVGEEGVIDRVLYGG